MVLLTGVYHVSRRHAVSLLDDLGVRVSLGALSKAEGRVSSALASSEEEIEARIDAAPVKHADGTTWLHSGETRSLWTIATLCATLFRVFVDGTAASIKPLFGTCRGILVSDRATVFGFWDGRQRQICWAHLKRRFVAFSEVSGRCQAFGKELLDCTGLIFKYWHDYKDGRLDQARYRQWMTVVRKQTEDCLKRAADANIPGLSGSCDDILAHKAALWTFVDAVGVEPTNNHAERELRSFVLWRKGSFGAQSERGHRFASRVMSVAHTARKQKRNVFAHLIACCEAALNRTPAPSLFAPAT
jgi:transposase